MNFVFLAASATEGMVWYEAVLHFLGQIGASVAAVTEALIYFFSTFFETLGVIGLFSRAGGFDLFPTFIYSVVGFVVCVSIVKLILSLGSNHE